MSGSSSSDSEVEDPVLNSYLRRLQAARASFGIVGSVVAPGWRSPAAEAFETWCIERAWQQCEKCHRRDPCILSESFLSPALSVHAMPKHAVCRHCAAGTGFKSPMWVDPESSDDESDEDLSGTRASGKELFMSLVFSEVTDYGSSYDLLHFFYDQWMFKTLGGAAAVCERNLRSTLSGKQFAPQYWTWQHQKLLDLVRQLGFPTLFVTLAP